MKKIFIRKHDRCQYCGEIYDKSELSYPKKGSPYLACTSCKQILDNEDSK